MRTWYPQCRRSPIGFTAIVFFFAITPPGKDTTRRALKKRSFLALKRSTPVRSKAIYMVGRPAKDPRLVFGGEERNQIFHDHIFEKVRPDQPLRAETIVQSLQEWPNIAVRRAPGFRGVMQRGAHVDVGQ